MVVLFYECSASNMPLPSNMVLVTFKSFLSLHLSPFCIRSFSCFVSNCLPVTGFL